MSDKIELKEKLAAVDLNVKSLWDDINDDQKKALKSEKLLTMSRHHLFQNSDVIKFNGKFLAIAEGGDQIFSVKQASIQKQYP